MIFSKGDLATSGGGPTGSTQEGKMKEMQAKNAKCMEVKAQTAKMGGKEGPKGQNDKINPSGRPTRLKCKEIKA